MSTRAQSELCRDTTPVQNSLKDVSVSFDLNLNFSDFRINYRNFGIGGKRMGVFLEEEEAEDEKTVTWGYHQNMSAEAF